MSGSKVVWTYYEIFTIFLVAYRILNVKRVIADDLVKLLTNVVTKEIGSSC